MKKILLLTPFLLLGAGQEGRTDTKTVSDTVIVETPMLNTKIGEAILKANAAEAEEADVYKKIDSLKIVGDGR